jgi:signal transduction histidine kinase
MGRAAIVLSIASTVVVVFAVALLCIAGDPMLPQVTVDYLRLSPLWLYFVGTPLALLSGLALIVLWFRRRSILDLWLMVVMCLFLIEVSLSYYPDPVRFSVGWYTVRIIGFLSSSLVLIVLLHEISMLYTRLLGAVLAQRREREVRLLTGDAVAASIAHEVRQPLTAMVTTADAGLRFLDRATPNLDRAKEAFRRIVADGHRAGQVIRGIRDNFRSDPGDMDVVDVAVLIHDALRLCRGDLDKHQIVVQADSISKLLQVRGNRIQLQQVLLNLIMNAIDAMSGVDGGRKLSITSTPDLNGHVAISVADNGTGIDAQEIDRIFAPLYSTKADGMGMGLAICRSIIEKHDGRLWSTSNKPRGTVFHVALLASHTISAEA